MSSQFLEVVFDSFRPAEVSFRPAEVGFSLSMHVLYVLALIQTLNNLRSICYFIFMNCMIVLVMGNFVLDGLDGSGVFSARLEIGFFM